MNIKKQTPPKTGMAFNVGVIFETCENSLDGKLIRNYSEALRYISSVVGDVYNEAADFYLQTNPKLRIITDINNSCENVLKEAASSNGFETQYVRSGKVDNWQIGRFEFKIEDDCRPERLLRRDIGQVILDHSDVIIVVCDGGDFNELSEANAFLEAMKQEIPVILLSPGLPDEIQYFYGKKHTCEWQKPLGEEIKRMLFPFASGEYDNKTCTETYFSEKQRSYNFGILYRIFKHCFSNSDKRNKRQSNLFKIKADIFSEADSYSWKDISEVAGDSLGCIDDMFNQYKKHYAWADNLAKYYADHYRSSGILRQLFLILSSIALALGFYWNFWVKGQPTDMINILGFASQALLLYLVIQLSKVNENRKWHRKFIDYRILAELLRHMRYLAPLGLCVRGLRLPAYNRSENVLWVNWLYRAIVRDVGLAKISLGKDELAACRKILSDDILGEEIEYYNKESKKSKAIADRINKTGMRLFWAGIIFIVLRVLVFFITMIMKQNTGLTAFDQTIITYSEKVANIASLLLPAIAAAVLGIEAQAGFQKLYQRYEAMGEQLRNMKEYISETGKLTYGSLKEFAEQTADIMISETADWRIFFKSKTIKGN